MSQSAAVPTTKQICLQQPLKRLKIDKISSFVETVHTRPEAQQTACVDHTQPATPTSVTDNLVVLIIVMIVYILHFTGHGQAEQSAWSLCVSGQ